MDFCEKIKLKVYGHQHESESHISSGLWLLLYINELLI